MSFMPLQRMMQRLEVAKQDSDVALFFDLLYFGEMVTKLVALGLIAFLDDDIDRHRYRQLYNLVRANSLGPWADSIQEILSGPTSHFLVQDVRTEQQELIKQSGQDEWQYESVRHLHKSLSIFDDSIGTFPRHCEAVKWFSIFVQLRNKTRGHGAVTGSSCGKACAFLEYSIVSLIENFYLFSRPWAYLHQNLSGKYRVTYFTQNNAEIFEHLKRQSSSGNIADGVYVSVDKPRMVELCFSDEDLSDLSLPNGHFTHKTFETISYITDNKSYQSSEAYLLSPTPLPSSHTQGRPELDARGDCLTNLPPPPDSYIPRLRLESELRKVLLDDRHPILTLSGRGGIGKTYLALSLLNDILESSPFVLHPIYQAAVKRVLGPV